MKRLKIVFYAINGTGLGHITRLSNIARDIKWLLDEMGVFHQIEFLTTSDAPHVAGDFLVTKIPSKTTIKEMNLPLSSYASRARLMIGNCLSMIQPDLLILDTTPQGSFNEFSFLKDFSQQSVFIERHRDEGKIESAIYQSHLKLYDLVIVPEEPDTANTCLQDENKIKRKLVGKISGYSKRESIERKDVRSLFEVDDDESLVYVSAGGGGDSDAEKNIKSIVTTLSGMKKTRVLVGNGPLYKGWQCYKQNIINMSSPNIRQYFAGVDYAISAGGYNTYEELLAAGVPTLFYPQTKGLDRQDLRVKNGVEKNWNGLISDLSEIGIKERIESFLTSGEKESIYNELKNRTTPEGRFKAAVEILLLNAQKKHSLLNKELLLSIATEKCNKSFF